MILEFFKIKSILNFKLCDPTVSDNNTCIMVEKMQCKLWSHFVGAY